MAMAAAVIVTAAAGPAAAGSGCVGRMGKSVEASIPGHAFKKVFYENDFRYLDDPCLALIDTRDGFSRLTDRAKRLRPMPDVVVDVGGEWRGRYQDLNGHARSTPNGLDDSFLLHRLRLFANAEVGQYVRVYAEGVDAASAFENRPADAQAENRWDVANLFAEASAPAGKIEATLRAGRQEILLGAGRLVAPHDWANARRTFDGLRAEADGERWSVGGFAVRPVTTRAERADRADGNRLFAGLTAAHTWDGGLTGEGYVLHLDDDRTSVGTSNVQTIGSRLRWRSGRFAIEGEGAIQVGSAGTRDRLAGMVAGEAVYSLYGIAPWPAWISATVDWASGDDDPTDGRDATFAPPFPDGHAFLGIMDLVGRRNVAAAGMQASARPRRWLGLTAGVHGFRLATGADALYNAAGTATLTDASGTAGTHIGTEFDFVAQVDLADRAALHLGYAHFWAGNFVDDANGVGSNGDAQFGYAQLTVRF